MTRTMDFGSTMHFVRTFQRSDNIALFSLSLTPFSKISQAELKR